MNVSNDKQWLFPQQFVLGPRPAESFECWRKCEIAPSLVLTSHPELNVCQYSHNHRTLILLGNILDPNKPGNDNFEITKKLLLGNSSFEEIIRSTFELCGNWICLYREGDKIFLFHDCTGARSVFYTGERAENELWFASQPRLIALLLGFKENPEAAGFMDAQKAITSDYWWPGDSSPYSEIKALLPNHYFDVRRKEVVRYWPDRNFIRLENDEARQKIASRLDKIMVAASHRFDLALALSGGWDSRLMLAASKNIKEQICVYNGKRPEMPSSHPDISIPRRLTSKLNLKYHYIPQSNDIDEDFRKSFDMNAPDPARGLLSGLMAEWKYFHRQKVGATGNMLEVARFFYKVTSPSLNIPTAESLALLTKMQNSPFAINAFENWLSRVKGTFNYNIYDLFYWEQRCGRWLSNNCLVFYMAWKDVFFPFNCRNLMIDLLSVVPEDRMPSEYVFFKDLMSDMWPGVLSEPINPPQQATWAVRVLGKIKKKIRSW